MDIADLLAHLNRHHGTAYALRGRCDGGTRGAYELGDARGRSAILKFGPGLQWLDRLRQAERIAVRLRTVGYPTPRTLALGAGPDGGWYQLQEFVVGAPMPSPLSPANLDHLLALNELQAARSHPTGDGWVDWSRYARDVVFADASGWTASLRAFSPGTRALLAALLERAQPFATAPLSTADVVHGDFLPVNVLVQDGRVAAAIDFAAAGCGTRALDLARLLVWSHADMAAAQRCRLGARLAAIATPVEHAICLAYGVIDLLAFVIEHHPADVGTAVERGFRLLEEVQKD